MNELSKKPYTAPRLRTIKLETKEVMSNICKATVSDINVGQPECGRWTPCAGLGS